MALRVAELFAGVGGFRVGLEAATGFDVVWSNQWEPGQKKQHASECYVKHFGQEGHSNADIHSVQSHDVPDHDLLVGGFPCQDYSVAATLDKSKGIKGKKGILWWQIDRLLEDKRPDFFLLENVDRLLRSPAHKRGRDFGIVLSRMAKWGYRVEWRVINAADYGFPHKRRRVFLFGAHRRTELGKQMAKAPSRRSYLIADGFFAKPFPVVTPVVHVNKRRKAHVRLDSDARKVSKSFEFHFANAGVMVDRRVWTDKVDPQKQPFATLESVLEDEVPEQYFVPAELVDRWSYLKGPKSEPRTAKNGHKYMYKEGQIPFPDNLDQPSRTILTSEGGTSPSRSNHLVKHKNGRYRVLMPVECEKLNGFTPGWTEGMPERWRYFCMGNALVVGLVKRMGEQLNGLLEPLEVPMPPTPSLTTISRRRSNGDQ